jgi:Uma2 family endonuclease
MSIAPLGREATLEDLYAVDGKAELVDGHLVLLPMTGGAHGNAVANIVTSLKLYQRAQGGGCPFGDNVGFVLSPRRSLAPDASWYVGPWGTRLLDGAPALAVEVRSEEDYGPAAECRMAAKRMQYFEAGTQVIWDVDVMREGWIRVYRAVEPHEAAVYVRGEIAEAEPAVPGWSFPVNELFD